MPTETLMMKVSKNTWYGNIPTDWVINKYKFICKISSGDVMSPEDLDDSYEYEVYGGGKLIGFANSYNTQNCILIGRVGANCGCITNISDKCWATDNALILKTSSNKNYMNYLLMASNLNDINESNAQPLITASKVLNFKIPFTCNINEQQAIADFLDKKCEKIDKVIGKIEEQIQVLEDYKKSLITETVTKGLDKNVPMKDSGIDWIGNIPKNWEVKKIKYIIQNNSDGIKVGPFGSSLTDAVVGNEDGEYKIYGQANLIRRDFNYGDNFVTEKSYKQLKNYEVLPNDICVSMMGTIGKCCVVPQNIQKGIMDSHLIKIRLSDEECPKYFEYCYESDMGFEQLLYYSKGSIMNGLNSVIVKNIYMPFPELNTQKEISDYLDKECKKIDKTISDKKEQLETIKEYKKSLIYEYVTGKKRVAC